MNLLKFVVSLFFITVAFAQNVLITLPHNGAKVHAGKRLTVQIERPDSLTGSQEVAVVIGLSYCTPHCFPPADNMGKILYNGIYRPANHGSPFTPYQNFTVLIPKTKGHAQLNVAHVTLIGAGLFPFLETLNTTLKVV